MNKLLSVIEKSERIAIISHINPDGDTCGSALALAQAMRNLGKSPDLLCESPLKNSLLKIAGAREFRAVPNGTRYELAVACDCADAARMGVFSSCFFRAPVRVNIDHHGTNDSFGTLNYVAPGLSATCELMYGLLKEIDAERPCLDETVAACLFTGLVTDSGGFVYPSVTPRTHIVAAELMGYGIDAAAICETFLKRTRREKFALSNRVLARAEFSADGAIAMIHFRREDFAATGTTEADTDGIINEIRFVEGVEAAIAVSDTAAEHSFKVSIRTGARADAAAIAALFGGGGHRNAAGCRISGFYEDVKEKLLRAAALAIC